MSERPRIVVVGSANIDFVVTSGRLPRPGETVTGGQFATAAGGKGANQAVAAARLGADATFVARLGVDAIGDEAVAGYVRDGLRTDRIVRDAERPTGVALILVGEGGENLISVAPGANEALSPEDVDRAADRIREADVLLLQLEVPMPAVIRAAEIAAEAGVIVVLDPAPAPKEPLPNELLGRVSFLTPNESEAERMTGLPVEDESAAAAAAERLRETVAGAVILTRGRDGAVIAGADGTCIVTAPEVESIDSTAAGDAFNAAFACAIAADRSVREAVGDGCLAGALATTRQGAQPSLPTAAEVEAFRKAASVRTRPSPNPPS